MLNMLTVLRADAIIPQMGHTITTHGTNYAITSNQHLTGLSTVSRALQELGSATMQSFFGYPTCFGPNLSSHPCSWTSAASEFWAKNLGKNLLFAGSQGVSQIQPTSNQLSEEQVVDLQKKALQILGFSSWKSLLQWDLVHSVLVSRLGSVCALLPTGGGKTLSMVAALLAGMLLLKKKKKVKKEKP